jgi:hypothetical protein
MQRAHNWLWTTIARRFGQETADQLKAEFEQRLRPAVSLLSVHRVARAVAAKQRPTLRQAQQLLTIIADQQREIDRLHAELADLDEREQTYAMLADDWGTIVDALQTVGIGAIEQGDGWKAIYVSPVGQWHDSDRSFDTPGEALAAVIRSVNVSISV